MDYAPAGPVNGNRWTILAQGQASARYSVRNGLLLTSHVVAHGTLTVYENGILYKTYKLGVNTAPDRYTCAGTTLRAAATNGTDSIQLTRHA